MSVIDSFGLTEISTKNAANILASLKLDSKLKKFLIITSKDLILEKSLRNLSKVKVISGNSLNVYDILNHKYLLFVGRDILDSLLEG